MAQISKSVITSTIIWFGDLQKYRFPIVEVKKAIKAPSLRHGFHGMALCLHGTEDLRFEFWSKSSRNDVSEISAGF